MNNRRTAMRRVQTALLAVLTGLAQMPAQASNWVPVGPPASKTGAKTAARHGIRNAASRYFVDKSSIVTTSIKQVKAWTLTSYAREQSLEDGLHYLSVKSLNQYNCEEHTIVPQTQVYYADAMGTGTPLRNLKYEKFTPDDILPDSPSDYALKIVCEKAVAAAEAAAAAAAKAAAPPPSAQDGKFGK